VDNCGGTRTVTSCGACTSPQTCGGGGTANTCACAPETDAAFCGRRAKNCGSVTGTDNCGTVRTVASCGTCTAPEACGQGGTANVCGCRPETNAAFCSRQSKNCGTVTAADNCGVTRTVASCGTCNSPNSCGGGGTDNVCGCTATPETDAQVCERMGKNCGYFQATDTCGRPRTVTSCGTCTAPETCGGGTEWNVCGCTSETDASFCATRGANCGTVTGLDRCGRSRTVSCGSCASPRECGGSGTANLCTLPLGDFPGAVLTKISNHTPVALFISANEQYVAYSTNRSDSPFGCFGRIGYGDLHVATLSNPPTVRRVEPNAGFNESFFTADSAHVVYTRYSSTDPCVSFSSLYRARLDGTTAPTSIHSGGYFVEIQRSGAAVTYKEKSYGSSDLGTLGAYNFTSNRTASLGYAASVLDGGIAPNGSAVLYREQSGVRTLRRLNPYTASGVPLLAAPSTILYAWAWAPDSSRLAYIHAASSGPKTLSFIAPDGTGRQDVVTDCRCQGVLFSPDGTRLVMDGTDEAGNRQLTVLPLAGGEPVILTGLPSTNGFFTFSPDGRWLRAELYTGSSLLLADTTQSGAFRELATNYSFGFTATSTWDYVGALLREASFETSAAVFPTAGGAPQVPVSTRVTWLDYERVASAPKLAVFHRQPNITEWGTLSLFGADGSGPARTVTTEAYSYTTNWSLAQPFWSGRMLLYSVNRRVDPSSNEYVFDLAATTSDGATSGLVARDVRTVRYASNPTRIFITRSSRGGGGLWMLELPR
jgi:hypothetical protein